MKKRFIVNGMSCANCSAGIEKYLSSLKGINNVSVSLLSKQMDVDFDEQILSEQIIIRSVEKLGYSIEQAGKKKQNKYFLSRQLKKRFFISLIALIPLMYLCLSNALGLPTFEKNLNFIFQFVLALIILILNRKFFISGVRAVFNKMPNMDTLVALGSASAFIYSMVMTILSITGKKEVHHVFFDGSAMVLVIITLGKWLEELSKIKTGDAVEKLSKMIPDTAVIMIDGQEQMVAIVDIKEGSHVLLRAGDYVPIDGVIVEGKASVDKSAITGESMPEQLSLGDKITSGTIIKSGYLIVEAQSVGADTLLSKIIDIVKTAGASKAPVQKMADKVAGVFVPIVVLISVITFLVWILLTADLYKAFNFALCVLVISCPCSLGLATPVAVMIGTANGAKKGVLFKDALGLQSAQKIDCVLLDKTATITVGAPKVVFYKNFGIIDEREGFSIVSALEQKSVHPLAQSIMDFCGASCVSVEEFKNLEGHGVVGEVYGEKYYLGKREILPENIKINLDLSQYNDKTLVFFANEDDLLMLFALSDMVKEDSVIAIKNLQDMGIKTIMLTGDNYATAKAIANQVGISEFYANVLPNEKYDIVQQYKEKDYFVAMVGDGINDAPALKGAHLGIAIGTGTDVAIDSADVILANGSLSGVTSAIKISKKTNKIIKENLFWALFYNCLCIPIAGGALSFANVVLTPIIASIMMSCSSLFVVVNALRSSDKTLKKNDKKDEKSKQIFTTVHIENMTCNHCVKKISEALFNLSGVKDVKVDLTKKTATLYREQNVAEDDVKNVIEQKGFKVNKIV